MKIALLHDEAAASGRPDELDGLVQVQAIEEFLRARGHETVRIGFGLDLDAAARALREARIELVVNLVEAVGGHGRLIHLAPSLLEVLGIPYTGARPGPMMLTSDKVWTKRLLRGAGLPTPAWVEASGAAAGDPAFPGRFIIKSVWEDASLGLDDHSVVEAPGARWLVDEIRTRASGLGGEAFAEAWIEGREFNLALVETGSGPRVLPPAEMRFVGYPEGKPRLVGYRAKWETDSFEYQATVRDFDFGPADEELLDRMVAQSLDAWQRFGLTGYARVDFRVDAGGVPWILELNPNPCISPDAGFAAAAARAGMDLGQIVDFLVEAALAATPLAVGDGNPAGR